MVVYYYCLATDLGEGGGKMISNAIILYCQQVSGKSNKFDLPSIPEFKGVLMGTQIKPHLTQGSSKGDR